MWLSSLASGLLLLAAPLDARITRGWSDQEVENRLRSTDALDIAWAAHEAGGRRLKQAVPALLDVLESPPEDSRRILAFEHTLDALIQLEAELRAPHVVHLQPENRVLRHELIILYARTPLRFESSLTALLDQDPEGMAFHAVASLLSKLRSRELAHRLLPRLSVELEVTVHDPWGRSGSFGVGCGGFGISGGARRSSAYPPPFDYELDFLDELGPEDTEPRFALVSEPRVIVARRLERTAKRYHTEPAPRQAQLVQYLVHLAGLPADSMKIPETQSETVEFESVAQVREFVEAAKARVLAPHERLRESLATQGLLDRTRWKETALPLTVVVEDDRSDKSIALDAVLSSPLER
jgi:hypothetical protein